MQTLEINNVYNMDCLEGMNLIPDGSIDMILCDLPYGTTDCKWDKSIIPFSALWEQYNRIIKENGVIVLTSAQPFTTWILAINMTRVVARHQVPYISHPVLVTFRQFSSIYLHLQSIQ